MQAGLRPDDACGIIFSSHPDSALPASKRPGSTGCTDPVRQKKEFEMKMLSLPLLAALALGAQGAAPAQQAVRISDVTVIDPASGRTMEHRTVTIENGIIAGIGPAGETDPAFAGREIDGRGRYLVPGLMDMHVHTNIAPVTETSFALLLAHGVTGVRDMSGDCWEPVAGPFLCREDMLAYAARIDAGDLPGPDLLALSSGFVQSDRSGQLPPDHNPLYTPATAEQGRALVDYVNERDVDLVKLYHAIMPAALEGVMQRAGELDLEVSGHIPLVVSTGEASRLGMRTIEHAKDIVTDCSGFGEEYRTRIRAVIAGDASAQWPGDAERLSRTVETFNPGRCRALMAELAANGTILVPTHGTREMDVRAGDTAYRDHPGRVFLPAMQLGQWDADLDRTAAEPGAVRAHYEDFYRLGLRVTAMAHEAGVPVMLGTDANDTMIVPGIAAHEELIRLVEAGLSPMEALQAGTSVPARYLGREGELGAIRAGAEADLLLLDADPLADIANTQDIAAVISDGRVYDRAQLDAILADVRARWE
jgi:imidazolonepropionase-like amidohydrolase